MKQQNNKTLKLLLAGILMFVSALNGCGRNVTNAGFNDTVVETVVDTTGQTEPVSDNADIVEFLNDSAEHCEETETAEAADETEPEISLVMVGDILLHTPVARSGVQEDGSYDFHALFANVKDEIEAADLALVNQEVIIGGEELGITGYPCFNAPYELGDALVDAGFDVVLHATNHTLDKGKKGVVNCLSFWKDNYPAVAVLGINDSSEAQDNNIFVYEQEGIRIAVLNYTYGTNGIPMPSDMPYAVNLLHETKVADDIKKAKAQADFVIVCPHWGTEYWLETSPEQEYWTKQFLENGVDLVIGTHPHVIEPVEWVRDDNGNEMLVYYSLGNFVNWTSSSGKGIANRMVGGMAEVTIARDAEGDVFVKDYGVEPLVCHLTSDANGVTTYFLSDYTEAMASQNVILAQDPAFSKEYCQALCEKVWGHLISENTGDE